VRIKVLIDLGLEEVEDWDRGAEVASLLAAWARRQEAELRDFLSAQGFIADIRSQAADYER
jgi:hypothetical protein